MKSNLNEELSIEREKLNRMIQEAMDNDKSILGDEDILKQSRKVDAILNRIQKKKDRDQLR